MFDGRFRSGVDRVVNPVGGALARTGLSPDHLTALGLLLSLPTAWALGTGRLGLGLGLLIASAVPDLLDGALAKASGRSSTRGAFFDSVCDRVTDTLVLGGVAWYLQSHQGGHAFMLPFAILGASLLISYERAKAESLGFDAKGGLMERAERVVVLCTGLAFHVLLVPLLWVMLVLTLATAGQRFAKVWRQGTAAMARPLTPEVAAPLSPVPPSSSVDDLALAVRWRTWREANGWRPRADRYAQARRGSSAGARWQERRRIRSERRGEGDEAPVFRRRSGSRRP
ncbi:MAG: CDP-alcohol phosphatidyltransferase family protein [Acidimicrobiales bacterium]